MKEYYFYKQKGFNANNREEIQVNFTPFEILTRYQPKDYNLPNVSNEQVETYKSELIKKAKEKNFTLNYSEQDYYYLTQCKEIKKEAEYFLIGKFNKVNGKFSTKKEDFIYKYLAVLDYENLSFTTEEFYKLIQSKLANYSYMLYKSVSYTEIHPRFRLIVDTDREMSEQENTSTIKSIANLIGVEPDTASYTYSQIQGLPLTINGNEYKPIINHATPYRVQEVVKEEKKIITKYTSEPIQNFTKVSHDQAISIMKKYIENEQDKLLERNDYYLSCLTVIAKSVVTGEIEYDTAIECMELLALNNDEWKENNLNELNGEIARASGNVDYFKNKYTFIGKFQKTQQKIKTTNALTNASLEITTDEKGKVIQTLENIEKIILSIIPIAYNELTDVIEVKDKQGKIKPLEKRDKELLRMEIEKRFKFKAKVIDLDTAIVSASDKFRYHPIKNQILAVSWDEVPRAETFFIDVLGVEDNVYNRECTRKWLLASLTRLFNNGAKFDEMIILQGGQGIGKSTTLQRLSLGYYTDITEKLSDEVTFKVMRTWLVELSELSTMMKTDSDSFKAWLSATKDTVRKKYGNDPDDYPRAFTVLGTTNNKEILKDRTGNRRYWLMYCDKDKIKRTIWSLDNNTILQLWSEVYQWYLNGENLLISNETKLYMEKLSSGALEFNPLEERINNILDMYVPNDWKEIINDNHKRYEYYYHVNNYVTYGKGNSRFPLQTQIFDITTGELCYLLGDGEEFYKDLRGNTLAKEINQVMNNLPNWKKSNNIRRSHSGRTLRGYIRKFS
ncbi:VapE domain-containing protein [Gemella morbillorum]